MTTERSSFDNSNVDAVLATRDDTMFDTGLDDSEPARMSRQGTPSTSTSSTSGDGDRLSDAAGGVAERVADTAQREVGTKVDSGLGRAGEILEQLAVAVRKGGEDMREQQPQIAGFADTAASQVDKAAEFVRETDFKGLIREAEGFARRQPAVFLGGALALGLLAARFLKASPETGSGASSPGRQYRGSSGSRYGDAYGYRGSYGAGYGSSSAGSYESARGMTGTSQPRHGSTASGSTASGLATSGTGVEHGGA